MVTRDQKQKNHIPAVFLGAPVVGNEKYAIGTSKTSYFVPIFFWAGNSVFATPFLMSPVLYFETIWIQTQRPAVASRRATN